MEQKFFRHYLKTKSDNTQVMLGASSFHSMIIANESLIVKRRLDTLRALGITLFTGPSFPLPILPLYFLPFLHFFFHHSSPSLPPSLPFLQFLLLLSCPLFLFISHPFLSHPLRSTPLNTVRVWGAHPASSGAQPQHKSN